MTFSIITITKNDLTGLKNTINSVLSQTFTDYEYLIIDGDSSDGTKAYLRNLNHKNLKWLSEPDEGIYDAMNKGVRNASCDSLYINMLNAGDYYCNEFVLENIYHQIGDGNSSLYGNCILNAKEKKYPKKYNLYALAVQTFSHQGSFFRTKFHKKNYYDTSYRIAGDYNFFVDAYFKKERFTHLNFPVCVFVGGGISSINRNLVRKENDRVRRKYPLLHVIWFTRRALKYYYIKLKIKRL